MCASRNYHFVLGVLSPLHPQIMLSCSGAVIAKRYPEPAVGGLLLVVVAQGFGYGLIFDLNFFLRNLSVIGGLLMVLSDSMSKRKSPLFAGLPNVLNETDRKKYFQLAGRVLLIFLFIGFVLNGKFTFARAMVSLLGLGACVMVVAGFKAKWSATFLVLLLSIFNLFVNNWWSVHSAHPQRDFLKYAYMLPQVQTYANLPDWCQIRLLSDTVDCRRAAVARQLGTRRNLGR